MRLGESFRPLGVERNVANVTDEWSLIRSGTKDQVFGGPL